MALRRTIQTPVGTDVVSAAIQAGQIEGIRIDNPSGSWLLVSGIDQYVPPYRSGWQYPVSPSQSSISVRFVDSPSGSLSVQVGGAVTIYLYDDAIAFDAGQPTGAGGRVTTIPPSQTVYAAMMANLPNVAVTTTVLSASTGPAIVRKLTGTYNLEDNGITPGYDPRAIVAFWWEANLGGGSLWLWQFAISPESPAWSDQFSDGALFLPTGADLHCTPVVQLSGQELVLGLPITGVIGQVEYYSEVDA